MAQSFLIFWGDCIAAFVCSILSGMGVGGGGMLMIYLTLVRKMDAKAAQQINLLSFVCSAMASLLRRPKASEGYTPLQKGVWIKWFVCALFGVMVGKALFFFVKERYFRLTYGIFLCLCGCYGLLRQKPKQAN